jgi:hypothetical protein
MLVPRLFRITKEQDQFLRKLPGSDSEHTRRALDEYIFRMTPINISSSASEQKGE